MPWQIKPVDGKFQVVKEADGSPVGKPHDTKQEAEKHMAALYANEPEASK